MSTVVSIQTQRLTVPLHTPFVTALRRTDTTDVLLVRVTDTGSGADASSVRARRTTRSPLGAPLPSGSITRPV